MMDVDLPDLLFRHTWWSWTDGDRSWHSIAVHTFNLVEGAIWGVFSALVLQRYVRFRRSRREWLYSLAFFTFGITDLVEAYALTSWLIWIKLANLIVLWKLRSLSLKSWYPGNRLF